MVTANIPNGEIKDLEKAKFVLDANGDVSVRTAVTVQDIEIGAVEIKNATSDQRATVDTTGALKTFDSVANSLVPSVYDYISLGYTGSNLTSVIYKTGGSGGTTVATLTLAYSGSDLVSVTKS